MQNPYWIFSMMAPTILSIAYYRAKAGAQGEAVTIRTEGYGAAVVLRLAGILWWVAVVGHILSPRFRATTSVGVPILLRWLGFCAACLSALFVHWTLSNLGNNLTDTVAARSTATLVTGGPYRWVRHPFYLCVALFMISISVSTGSVVIAAISVVMIALLVNRTKKEEEVLWGRFGHDYEAYVKRSGRFVPTFGSR